MDRQTSFRVRRFLRQATTLVLIGLLLSSTTGCLLDLYAAATHDFNVPPECNELIGKRVAVVCNSSGDSLGPSSVSTQLSMALSRKLAGNVEGIQVVSQREIDEWLDTQDWARVDAKAIARGVSADAVVVIDLNRFSLHEGQTMYKGRAEVSISLYDMNAEGREIFRRQPPLIEHPRMAGQPVSDLQMNEEMFRQKFIDVVTDEIGRYFYPWDYRNDYAADAAGI